ncbi:hypothetical protein ACTQ54_11015 [Fundicoccus sp. Sow4_H7]|uniref:hypothetical protein n=1 Tax=Fundicoccus sp. Sow4_H7 TaxID=3438784 RepID=UPI003F90BA93
MSKTVKGLVLAALVVILVLVLRFYTFLESRTVAQQPTITESSVQVAEPNWDRFYVDEDKRDFLRTDITIEEIEAVENEFLSGGSEEFLAEIASIKNKFEAQNAVNDLFDGTEKAIDGDQVTENLPLKENLTLTKVEDIIAKYYFNEDAQSQQANSLFFQIKIVSAQDNLDAFEVAVNTLLDYTNKRIKDYDAAAEALKEVKNIKIEDGQIGVIGQTMRKFERLLEKVEEESYRLKLDKDVSTYVKRFIEEISVLMAEIPNYYDLVLVALEPSELLTTALQDNQENFKFASEEEESESVEEESSIVEEVIPPVYSEPEYSWSQPEYSWSQPEYSWSEPEYSWSEPESSWSEPPVESYPDETIELPTEPTLPESSGE